LALRAAPRLAPRPPRRLVPRAAPPPPPPPRAATATHPAARRGPGPAAAAAAAAAPGDGSGSESDAELVNPALASTDFANIKVLDPTKVYAWLRRYQPFASLSSEAVREISEVRRGGGRVLGRMGGCASAQRGRGPAPRLQTASSWAPPPRAARPAGGRPHARPPRPLPPPPLPPPRS
jgi:hypothetical protein